MTKLEKLELIRMAYSLLLHGGRDKTPAYLGMIIADAQNLIQQMINEEAASGIRDLIARERGVVPGDNK